MSETYAGGGAEQARNGGVIIGIISVLSAVLVIAGLGYAAGTGSRHQAALAAAGCEPNLSPSGLQCTTAQVLTSQFNGIVTPATQQVDTDGAAYAASETRNRAAAAAALAAEVTVEKSFGASLAHFPFPPAAARLGQELIKANQATITLTTQQAQSPSLFQMRSFNLRVNAARAAVQSQAALLAKALAAPPAASQEP